ncbi:MAG TPA: hypothetical protein VH678_26380 [Xanthobacteraceae bacterium]|jgi:hypothetical protein
MLVKQIFAGVALAVAATALATPSSAQAPMHPRAERASKQAAIHDCSLRAGKINNTTDETRRIVTYYACMGDHGWQE